MAKSGAAAPAVSEVSAGGGGGGGSTVEGILGAFTDRMRAYNDFVRAVGEYKLNEAQADLIEAQAAGAIERAMILDAVRTQLIIDLEALNAESAAAARKIAAVTRRAGYAIHLLNGTPMADFNGCVDAYKTFEKAALLEADEKLFAPLSVATNAITGADFLDNRDPDRPCQDPRPTDLANAIRLINWSFRMRYIALPGSEAQHQFVRVFQTIGTVADRTVGKIRTYLDQLKSSTYKTWNPVQIIGLESSSAARSILENPGPNSAA